MTELNKNSFALHAYSLDGLRGWAALSVVFYHSILHNDLSLIDRVLYQPVQNLTSLNDLLAKLALTVFNGELAVYLFFILSGTVLRLSLDRQSTHPLLSVVVSFVGSRILRLYPPLVVCLSLFFLLGFLGLEGYPKFHLINLFENASLTRISMHGPSSTIQAEVFAIPFILSAWMLSRTFGVLGIVFAICYGLLSIDQPKMVFSLPMMHAYIVAFFAGMLAAEPRLRPILREVPTFGWLFMLGIVIFLRMFHHHSSLMALVSMITAGATLIAGLLYGGSGILTRILESKLSLELGKVSYSFYLYNVPVLYIIWAFSDRYVLPREYPLLAGLAIGLCSVIITYPVAKNSQLFIEEYSIFFGKKFSAFVFSIFDRNVK